MGWRDGEVGGGANRFTQLLFGLLLVAFLASGLSWDRLFSLLTLFLLLSWSFSPASPRSLPFIPLHLSRCLSPHWDLIWTLYRSRGSLFHCQCHRECPHKSNAIETPPRPRNGTRAAPPRSAPRTATCENEVFEVVCARVRHSSSAVCLPFPLAPIHSPSPWEFVDQHLLKKLLGVRVYNWSTDGVQWVQSLFLCGTSDVPCITWFIVRGDRGQEQSKELAQNTQILLWLGFFCVMSLQIFSFLYFKWIHVHICVWFSFVLISSTQYIIIRRCDSFIKVC